MIKLDYISTKDLNKVARIHSSKKYFNWIMKIIDNEYRFYPPIVIEQEDDLDDFIFDVEDDDISNLDNILEKEELKEEKTPMFGEFWNKTKFLVEEKFQFSNILESKLDKKMHSIKKGMNSLAKIEQYTDTKIKFSRNSCTKIHKEKFITFKSNDDSYKLYRVKQNSNCLAKINKYKDEFLLEEKANKVSRNTVFAARIKRYLKNTYDDIEILSFE